MANPLYQRISVSIGSMTTPRVSAISYGRSAIKEAPDFNPTGLVNNDVIVYDATNHTFEGRSPDILSANLTISGANDLNFPTFANGYVMVYNANTSTFFGESPSVFAQTIQTNLDAGYF